MRKALTWSLALVFVSAIALAQSQENPSGSGKGDTAISGTITKVDTTGKMLTIKDSSGNEKTVAWTDSTKISGGSLQEGATVQVTASDKGGSLTATSIQVKAAKPY